MSVESKQTTPFHERLYQSAKTHKVCTLWVALLVILMLGAGVTGIADPSQCASWTHFDTLGTAQDFQYAGIAATALSASVIAAALVVIGRHINYREQEDTTLATPDDSEQKTTPPLEPTSTNNGSTGDETPATNEQAQSSADTTPKQPPTLEQLASKMQKNAIKARKEREFIHEYYQLLPDWNDKTTAQNYPKTVKNAAIISEEALINFKAETQVPQTTLSFKDEHAEEQGERNTMEDARFYISNEQGTLSGVFDGHGGKEVANYTQKRTKELFFKLLEENRGNVHATFTTLFDQIEGEIKNGTAEIKDDSGSTAVLCFIDPKTNKIYTATIGDSEACIYRTINGETRSIPISCARSWGSKKDYQRLFTAGLVSSSEPPPTDPKTLRYRNPKNTQNSLNVSRALGDESFKNSSPLSPLIHKPKITEEQLYPGDKIVIACDGLRDYVTEAEIIEQLALEGKPREFLTLSELAACVDPDFEENYKKHYAHLGLTNTRYKNFILFASTSCKTDFNQNIQNKIGSLQQETPPTLAERLALYALYEKSSTDNVTVVVLTAQEPSQ